MQKGYADVFTPFRIILFTICCLILAAWLYQLLIPTRCHYEPSCINNQRKLIVAVQMYCQDNDEYFPDDLSVLWRKMLKLDKDTLLCPIDGRFDRKHGYGLNSYIASTSLTEIDKPEQVLTTADSQIPNSFLRSPADINRTRHGDRHERSFVVSYLDGHVGVVKAGAPIVLDWEKIKGVKR